MPVAFIHLLLVVRSVAKRFLVATAVKAPSPIKDHGIKDATVGSCLGVAQRAGSRMMNDRVTLGDVEQRDVACLNMSRCAQEPRAHMCTACAAPSELALRQPDKSSKTHASA